MIVVKNKTPSVLIVHCGLTVLLLSMGLCTRYCYVKWKKHVELFMYIYTIWQDDALVGTETDTHVVITVHGFLVFARGWGEYTVRLVQTNWKKTI